VTDTPPWELLAAAGEHRYDGEDVTQLQHALQAAAHAKAEGAPPALQLAALFHDVGHLLVKDAGAASAAGRDLRHERTGSRWLGRWYGDDVTGPIALHVDAKRVLARDPAYLVTLSDASRRTLALQGGPMGDDEAAAFRARPHAAEALRLRRWDDLAKDVDARVPGLEAWVETARGMAGDP
jgi:gamma-butyrobetaine dioxygenase